MRPGPIEILSTLVRVLNRQAEDEREANARQMLADLRARFGREYREMTAELRCRGSATTSTEEQYAERRMTETARWNGWLAPSPSASAANPADNNSKEE